MYKSRLLAVLVLLGAFVAWGCEKQEASSSAEQAAQDAQAAAKDAAGSAKDAAGSARDAAAGAVDAAAEKAADTTGAMTEEAQKLLDQAMAYIKENKFDLAEQAITKLEGMKAQLPASLQTGVDNARTALTAAKKAAGN